jgi:hypothetical protein
MELPIGFSTCALTVHKNSPVGHADNQDVVELVDPVDLGQQLIDDCVVDP